MSELRNGFVILNNAADIPVLNAGHSHEEMESKCRRCGVACQVTVTLGGRNIVVEQLHCKYLAHTDGRWGCTVYEDRLALVPWCHDLRMGAEIGALATDCPYVEGAEDYIGKTKLSKEEMQENWAEILDEIRSVAWEPWWNLDEFAAFLTATTPGYVWSFEPAKEYPGSYWLEYQKV